MSIAVGLRPIVAAACLMLLVTDDSASQITAAAPSDHARTSKANGAPTPIKLLKIEPVKGYVGDSFTIHADGLPAGKNVEFFWRTVDASYVTKVLSDNVEYHERKYDDKRVLLGTATIDSQGRASAKFSAPEDFGEVHDIFAVVDGQDAARGGFRVLRSATMTPSEGTLGTPITVTVKGIGWQGFEQFMALRYDNKYSGEISAVTTQGTAVFQIRAAGGPGKHIIQLNNSTAYAPGAYLNTQQSPLAYIYSHIDNQQEFRFVFNVTQDAGAPPDKLEWPDGDRIARLKHDAVRTTMTMASSSGNKAVLNPSSGTVHSQAALRATGLPPNSEV